MKYIEEFQSPAAVLPALELLKSKIYKNRTYKIMEFCGGHTHTFFKSGLIDLLPPQIQLVHGPGCPVCVLPSHPIENVIELLEKNPDIILATYADLMSVPTKDKESLLKAKGRGLNIKSIYSPIEALTLARENPHKIIVFLAIGFETTIPPTLMALEQAIKEKLTNFRVYCNHLNTTMALTQILKNEKGGGVQIDGLIGPGHVSAITGSDFFMPFSEKYKKPIVIAGFTAYDLVQSLVMLVEQINTHEYQVGVEYRRVVNAKGSLLAQDLMNKYLENRKSFEWRGLGEMPESAFKLKPEFHQWDAEVEFDLKVKKSQDHPHCLCPKVLMGAKNPMQCKLFAKACTPESPFGPCMVSSEGACSAYYLAGRHLKTKEIL
ncbi:MAG: hydrogenase formation protein HypD [Bdellovibrionaceae bacterium]|jgi:hydrogenase expression/formation protein HypD|nr:hydrogenase formation protein HypD [Pseudobdellovibrionaceae bacterium]